MHTTATRSYKLLIVILFVWGNCLVSTSSRDMHGGSPVRLNKKGTRLHTPSPDPEARQSLKRKESLESGVRIATVWQQKRGLGKLISEANGGLVGVLISKFRKHKITSEKKRILFFLRISHKGHCCITLHPRTWE